MARTGLSEEVAFEYRPNEVRAQVMQIDISRKNMLDGMAQAKGLRWEQGRDHVTTQSWQAECAWPG